MSRPGIGQGSKHELENSFDDCQAAIEEHNRELNDMLISELSTS